MQHDLERGERIRELREDSHMTQPAIAERVGVTLRAYQKWEEGGGLAWENLEALAKLHRSTVEFIARGETPDLLGTMDGVPEDLRAELKAIHDKLDSILNYLTVAGTEHREATPEAAPKSATKSTRQAAS